MWQPRVPVRFRFDYMLTQVSSGLNTRFYYLTLYGQREAIQDFYELHKTIRNPVNCYFHNSCHDYFPESTK